ncbi:immunity 49 family protein [Chryseobacterium gambrini]|uniref:Immunity 49 family protein n=1 Tax=Chryseobacterium gambrini TaxID=373672 RepID=A0AAJ1R8B0_9FLAO|nr:MULTISPECIES: immunity 49 family protein [Chryseobacterium]MDN4015077.1 immunity 49 family protein [Chryseobacterium gambrini]MDN4028080.1 immunity 49 family protein [Chryseobacterium gambrini]QWA39796.1 immunity 49 family protein [Chryseobacterium sp. ZHDP1]
MEKINLHKVDLPDVIKENYDWLDKKLYKSINKSKEAFRFLFYVYKDSSELLQMSVLEKPELSQQKYWFTYGLNCISEFCRLAHFPNEVKEAQIDESGVFSIKVEETNQHINILKALSMATIARDKEKQKIIADSPLYLWEMKDENLNNGNFVTCFLLLMKEYYSNKTFNEELFEKSQQYVILNKSEIGPDIKQKFWIYYMNEFLIALKSLVADNEAEFNQNLIKTIKAHQEVWSQKKALNRGGTPLCRSNEGFLSWECTALAAMAYDKGWKLEVESDYIPGFMVDGSINK